MSEKQGKSDFQLFNEVATTAMQKHQQECKAIAERLVAPLKHAGWKETNLVSRFVDDFNSHVNHITNMVFEPTGIARLADRLRRPGDYPRLDVFQSEGEFRIEAAVPGMMVDDLEVSVFQDGSQKYVRLTGKAVAHCREGSDMVYLQEIKRSSFSRVIPVPNDAEGDPKVMLRNGILDLSWKLATAAVEEDKEKKIPIAVQ